jgi:hypothetical protein
MQLGRLRSLLREHSDKQQGGRSGGDNRPGEGGREVEGEKAAIEQPII